MRGKRSAASLQKYNRPFSQYRSNRYQALVHDYRFRSNMIRKENSWGNVDRVRADIFEYIELLYNYTRRHSANGYISPDQYEREHSRLNMTTFRE
jgi:transposase InsO family protein